MRITLAKAKELVSSGDLTRGKTLYEQKMVTGFTETKVGEDTKFTCQVRDGQMVYNVQVLVGDRKVRSCCGCYTWMDESVWMCEHVGAALFAIMENQSATGSINADNSDAFAQSVMKSYLNTDLMPVQHSAQKGTVRLVVKLDARNGYIGKGYPQFVLAVGSDKLYLVRSLREFAQNVVGRKTASYGKALTLLHSPEMFDEASQPLLEMVLDNFRQFRDFSFSSTDYNIDSMMEGSKELFSPTGQSFDRLFDYLVKQGGEVAPRNGGIYDSYQFLKKNPEVSVSLKKERGGVELTVHAPEDLKFFGNATVLYAVTKNKFFRCNPTFRQRVYPFLTSEERVMHIAEEDMPSFTNFILLKLKELVPVEDPDNLMASYLPDDFTARFYFDLTDENVLTLKLAFLYGEQEIFPDADPTDTSQAGVRGKNGDAPAAAVPVKRNAVLEQEIRSLAAGNFNLRGTTYLLKDGVDLMDFLGEGLPAFRNAGEVFISQRLKNVEIQPSVTQVGISVAQGILTLTINTGEFPPEELEDLYETLLQKRKYYKLKDGRMLRLEGSSLETMAEMSHFLRLSPKDLAAGQVKVPAFRALYLDNLLSNSEDFNITRDKQFRSMIRSFKSVKDSDYVVPENLENVMRPYQKVGFQWLKTLESCNFGGILADEMGLGKTVEAIAYLATVPRSQSGNPSLIVCPASLILNWMDEFARFAPQLNVIAVMGTAADRKRILAEKGPQADVWVTSYELLRQDVKRYEDLNFYCCILDEGQHVKNQTTQASKAVKQVNCVQRFILTGTPIENRLSELWNLFDFLMPGYLFSHNTFLEKLEKPVVKSKDEEAMAQLRKLVQPFMLRRLKKDVLKELPPIIEHVHRIPLSEEGRKVYLATSQKALQSLSMDGGSKFKILAALTRLRQICCDPNLCFENYTGRADKLEACLDLCSGMVENGHQILLFSQFTSMLDIIRQRLDEAGISSYTLQGSTTKEMRAKLVKDFNNGGASVFLISLKAGGTGLNLTAADVVIHYDPWWNTAAQDQATGRAHRIGQQANVQVYKLITQDTIEERIMELQEKKQFLMDALSDESGESLLTMSKEDLLALLN